ncbi:MAG: D-alanine--D-alanine ligase [bacterium]
MDLKKYFRRKKIAVLMGGWSAEREISLKTGKAVSRALHEDGFCVEEIILRKTWLADLKKRNVSFVFIALHGPYGEDGTVQGLLDAAGIPYSGPGVSASAVSMNKAAAKAIWDAKKLVTPAWWEVHQALNKNEIKFFENKLPVVIKPNSQGSAFGVSIVRHLREIPKAVQGALTYDTSVLIEKYISGTEITVGIIGRKPLEVIEIKPKGSFYDFKSKYEIGGSDHIIPANVSKRVREKAKRIALSAYQSLGCEVMARIDMMVNRQEKIFLLESNTIPGMTETSLLPEAARFEGMSFLKLVKKIIELSLQKK